MNHLKNVPGDQMTEVSKLQDTMTFKNIQLSTNSKLNSIKLNQFVTSLVNNIKSKLLSNNNQDEIIIQNLMIIDSTNWPENIDIRFGENEVKQLC